MLYGTNASKASGDSHDRDYDPAPITGLAAISPMRRPRVTSDGGGSISPQGGGEGGGAGEGETAVSGSRAQSSWYGPADRSTSIRFFAAQGKARQAFAKSGRGSKESPMSPGSWATPAGLSGLDFGWGNLLPPRRFRSGAFLRPFWMKRKSKPAPPPPVYVTPLPTIANGLEGLDGFGGWLKDRFTPPGGKITRIQPIPQKIRNVIPKPIRTVVRYAGAIPYTATVGMFTPASVDRKIFGLSPTESKWQERGAKAARVIAATVATAGAAGAMGYGPLAAQPLAAGYAPAMSPLALSTTPAAPVFAANTAGYATPAMFGGTGTIFTGGSYAAAPSLYAASSAITPALSAGMPLSGSASLIATPASLSSAAPAVAKSGYLASTGKALVSGVGQVAKAVGIQVGAQALLASMNKPGEAAQAQEYYAGEFGSAPATALPAFSMPSGGGYGGGGGGESSDYGQAIAGMGYTPLIGLGLAGLGLALYLKNRKSNTWRAA